MNRAMGFGVFVCLAMSVSACFVEPLPRTVRPVQTTYVTAPAPQQTVYVGGGEAPVVEQTVVGGQVVVGGAAVGGGVYVSPGGAAGACGNTCRYAYDGECDDGRSGAHTSLCTYGSDCGDCGVAY